MPSDLSKKVSAGSRAKLIAFAKTQDAKRNATIKHVVSSRAHEVSASLAALNESRLAAVKKVAGISAFERALISAVEALRKGIANAGRDAKKRRQAIFEGYPRVKDLFRNEAGALAQAITAAERQRYNAVLRQLAAALGNFHIQEDLQGAAVFTSNDGHAEPPPPFTLEPPFADDGTFTQENANGLADPLQFTFADSGDFLSSSEAADVGGCDATLMFGSFFSAPRGDFTFRISPKLLANEYDLNAIGVGGVSYASYLFVAELVEADDGFSQLQTKFVREVLAPGLWHSEASGTETKTVLFRFPSPGPGTEYLIRAGVQTTCFTVAPFGLASSGVPGKVESIGVEIV